MKKAFFFTIILLVFTTSGFSQQNKPYFQQHVSYNITAKYTPTKRILSAFEKIKYTNNSPDTLKEIYFHIWANAYKNRNTPYVQQAVSQNNLQPYYLPDSERGYCDNLNFKINGQDVKTENVIPDGEIVKLILNKPLQPGDSIEITTPFRVKVPYISSRMGIWGSAVNGITSFTQWYPKPAVYDKYGWHYFPYLDQGEFYSEFGKFEVTISVPESYIVAATGDLKTEKEYKIYRQMAKEANKNKKVSYPSKCDTCYKTLKFYQDSVHDFAWFISKQFIPRFDTIKLDNGHIVELWTFNNKESDKYWKNTFVRSAKRSIYYLSKWNYPYPYSTCKVVFGGTTGGGMEYPTITIIDYAYPPDNQTSPAEDSISYDEVIFHEIGHNWFYGILGFNERKYPFMDEGINTSNELRYMLTAYKGLKSNYLKNIKRYKDKNYLYQYYFSTVFLSSFGAQIPITSSSTEFSPLAYGTEVYMKTAYLFYSLREYLSDEEYDKAMHHLFEKMAFKHPYPEDIKQAFEESTGMDLSWFFDGMLNTSGVQDYKLKKVKKEKVQTENGTQDLNVFYIKQKGNLTAPVYPGKENQDGLKMNVIMDTIIEGKAKIGVSFDFPNLPSTPVKRYYLDNKFSELATNNNSYYPHKLFKRANPLKPEFLLSIPDNEHSFVNYFLPVPYYSYDKGLSIGAAFYNTSVIFKKWQFLVMPFVNLSKGTLMSGYGRLTKYWFTYNSRTLNYFFTGISGSSFRMPFNSSTNYVKGNFYAGLKLKNKYKFNRQYWMITDNNILATDLFSYYTTNNTDKYSYYNILHAYHRSFKTLAPSIDNIYLETGNNYSKLYASGYHKQIISRRKHYISLSYFAGMFLFNNTNNALLNFRTNGTFAFTDYTYSNIFPATGSVSNPLIFASKNPYQSNKWMLGGTFEISLPVSFISAYFTAVKMPEYYTLAETGFNINIAGNFLRIEVPMYSNATPENLIYGKAKFRVVLSLDASQLDLFRTYEEMVTVAF